MLKTFEETNKDLHETVKVLDTERANALAALKTRDTEANDLQKQLTNKDAEITVLQ